MAKSSKLLIENPQILENDDSVANPAEVENIYENKLNDAIGNFSLILNIAN